VGINTQNEDYVGKLLFLWNALCSH